MEESKALSRLGEAADLLVLLEDILNPSSIERLSSASWSGIRLTLKNARQTLQESQSTLAKEFVARSRQTSPSAVTNAMTVAQAPQAQVVQSVPRPEEISSPIMNPNALNGGAQAQTRRDLKASLEKFIDGR